MKINLDTTAKCWDYSFGSSGEKTMTVGEFLNFLKSLEFYTEPYDQNKEIIDKWLAEGHIETDDFEDTRNNIRFSEIENNFIEIWYEYVVNYDGDYFVERSFSYINYEFEVNDCKNRENERPL